MNFGIRRFFKKDKELTAEMATFSPKSAAELKALILKTGATIETEEVHQFLVGFQGGKFLFSYQQEMDVFDIIYPNFEQFDHKHIGWANMVANSINAYYGGWNCYFRIAEDGEMDQPVNMSLSYRLWLTGNEAQIVRLLKDVLEDSFRISREFTDRLKKTVSEHVDLEKLYTIHDFNNKLSFIHNQVRMGHDGNLRSEEEWVSDNKIPVSSLLDVCADEELGNIENMRVFCGEQVELISDAASVQSFDICDYIRQYHTKKDLREIFLFVRFEFGSLDLVLSRTTGCTERTLYYQIQYVKNTSAYVDDFSEHVPSNGSVLLEVRLTSDKEDYWEAKYMIEEAQGRKAEDLSAEDRAILSFVDLDLSSDFYWGRKFFNEKCYFQSLRYFLKIFQGLKKVWQDLSEEQKNSYYDVCYYIGFVYMGLKMYDKAYYYLNRAKESNSITAIQEYINCLCSLEDPMAISTIHTYLKQIHGLLNDLKEDESSESLEDFNSFLLRRLAYMFVNQASYDEAEDLLNRMIENGDSVEFAQSELDYIKQLRKMEELRKNIDKEKKEDK